MTKEVDLSKFDNSWYNPGGFVKRLLWYYVNVLFFKSSLVWPNLLKIFFLKIFGAKVGNNINIKPCVNIKYPWFLLLGDNVWVGENVWIDNLAEVKIGNNVCISQGALIISGSHDISKPAFDTILEPITIEDGVWLGAKSVVGQGVSLGTHSVIMAGSVVIKNTKPWVLYGGNPASPILVRTIS